MSWNTEEGKTIDLVLDGHQKADGTIQLVNDFDQWKLGLDHLPTAKEAWDEQQITINELQVKLVAASETLKRARGVINELKKFNEETIGMLYEMEKEKDKLAAQLGDTGDL